MALSQRVKLHSGVRVSTLDGRMVECHVVVRISVPIVKLSDMNASAAFYCEVLGFRKHDEYLASPDGPAYLTVLLGSAILHLSSIRMGIACDSERRYRDRCRWALRSMRLPCERQ